MKRTAILVASLACACGVFVSQGGAGSNQTLIYKGIYCEAGEGAVVCMRKDGRGYSVGMTKRIMMIHYNGKRVWMRYQP